MCWEVATAAIARQTRARRAHAVEASGGVSGRGAQGGTRLGIVRVRGGLRMSMLRLLAHTLPFAAQKSCSGCGGGVLRAVKFERVGRVL